MLLIYIILTIFFSQVVENVDVKSIHFERYKSYDFEEEEDGLFCKNDFKEDSSEVITPVFTACLWINAFRSFEDSLIASFHNKEDEKVFKIGLSNGKLYAKKEGCYVKTSERIVLREWQFSCFISTNNSISIIMDKTYSNSCPEKENINVKSLILGSTDWNSIYDGKIADVRVYWRLLPNESILQVKTFTESVTGNYSFDYEEPEKPEEEEKPIMGEFGPRPELEKECTATVSEVSSDKLLAPYYSEVLMPMLQKESFSSSEYICSTFGGRLPSNSSIDVNHLPDLISEYFASTNVMISKFWISTETNTDICLRGHIANNNLTIEEVNCSTTFMKFFCLLKKNKGFRISEKLLQQHDFTYLYPVANELFMFTSNTKFLAILSDTYFSVQDLSFGMEIGSRKIQTVSSIVGRHLWDIIINDEEKLITFSSCDDDMFTCSDGGCFNLSVVCDTIQDCNDGSDEINCEAAIDPGNKYTASLSPGSVIEKTPISLYLMLERIIDIDMNKHILKFSFHVRLSWKDKRLHFKNLPLNKSIVLSNYYGKKYWLPGIFVPEATNSDQFKLSPKEKFVHMTVKTEESGKMDIHNSYEVMMFDGEQVTIQHENLDIVSVFCKFYIFDYPFDVQTCQFQFELMTELAPNVKWDVENSELMKSDKLSLLLYTDPEMTLTFQDDAKAIITFSITRKFGGFVFTTLFPCIVLQVIGLLTHVFPCDDYQDRVTVTLSCLIVMAALFTQLSNVLPDSAEPKLIDIWMCVHVAVLFFIFINHMFVIHFNQKYVHGRKRKRMNLENSENINGWTKSALKRQMTRDLEVLTDSSNESRIDKKVNKIGFFLNLIVYIGFLIYFISINSNKITSERFI